MLAQLNCLKAAVLSGVTASLLAATSAAAAQPDRPVVVYGDPQENVRTERIPFADLNLAETAGEKALFQRVEGAVERVCLYRPSVAMLQDRGYRLCAGDAWDEAKPQIAQAVARAREIALTGKSSIAATAITISVAAN